MDALPNEERIRTYFSMLKECFDNNYDSMIFNFIVNETKKMLRTDNITDDAIYKIFSEPENYYNPIIFNSLFGHLTNEYALMQQQIHIESEESEEVPQLPASDKILKPSATYPELHTFEFGSMRCRGTPFDSNFVRKSRTSMLLFISTHGSIVTDDDNKVIVKTCNGHLNKFSASGAGQCAYVADDASRYIVYALCDAIKHNSGILDVSTILREGTAHHFSLGVPQSAVKMYAETPATVVSQHEASNQKKFCIKTKEMIGDKTTFGNQYVQKRYSIKPQDRDGIFICKTWKEIGAKPMDNLLENEKFIAFMSETFPNMQLSSVKPLITNTDENVPCIRSTLLSNVIQFCEMYNKPEISIVDNSCSTINGAHKYTPRQLANIGHDLDRIPPNVAKGVKRNKRTTKKKLVKQRSRTNKRSRR